MMTMINFLLIFPESGDKIDNDILYMVIMTMMMMIMVVMAMNLVCG